MNRNTRRLSVTDAGRLYYERAKALLDLVEETEHIALDRQTTLAGRMRIATSVAFGRRVVTPLILEFMKTHPEIEIDLRCDDAFVDLVAQGIDVSVRLGRLADSSLSAKPLGVNPWVLVAAPAYLSKRPAPTEPQDLGRHDVLVYSSVHGDDQLHFTHPRHERASVPPQRMPILSGDIECVR